MKKSYNFNNFFAESACLRLPCKHSPVLISAADADPSPDSVHNRVTRAPNKFAVKEVTCAGAGGPVTRAH